MEVLLTVAFVAAIGLIIFGVIILLRYRKRTPENTQPPTASMYSHQSPPPNPPMQQVPLAQGPPLPVGYMPGYVQADNRDSIMKPPYDPSIMSSPPGSPPPPHSPPPPSYGFPPQNQQNYVPQSPSAYSPVQAQYNQPLFAQQAPAGNLQISAHPPSAYPQAPTQAHSAVELPVQRGDAQLRELA
jgi:hypothetical protein